MDKREERIKHSKPSHVLISGCSSSENIHLARAWSIVSYFDWGIFEDFIHVEASQNRDLYSTRRGQTYSLPHFIQSE